MNPAVILIPLLFASLFQEASASTLTEIETGSAKKRVALCFSPSPHHLLSINERGNLVSIKAGEGTPTREIQIESASLSTEEISSIREIVLAVERDFESSLMDIPSEVISISEVAIAPRDHKVPKGMVVWRLWIDGRAWEFYARSSLGDTSPWNNNLALLEEIVTGATTRASSMDLEPDAIMVVFEKPRHYFIPNLHASIIPRAKVVYAKKIRASDLGGEPHPLSSTVGYDQPGAWFFTTASNLEYLTSHPFFLSREMFVRGVKNSSGAGIDERRINNCPIARENTEATVWMEPVGSAMVTR